MGFIPILNILESQNNDIGRIGPGVSCLTHKLKILFGRYNGCNIPSAMLDAYSQYYNEHTVRPGTHYVLNK